MAFIFRGKRAGGPADKQARSKSDKKQKKLNEEKKPEIKDAGKRPKMRRQAPVLVGVDITGNQVKVAVGQYAKGKIVIKQLLRGNLPERSVSEGIIGRPLEVGMSLKNLLREHKVSIKNVVGTVEDNAILRREISLPGAPAAYIDNMLKYELDQSLPVDLSSYVLQYKVLDKTKDGNMNLNVYAMPKKMAMQYQTALKNGGLKPWALDTHTNGLEKLIYLEGKTGKRFNQQNLVFIDMGRSQFGVSFFSGGKCFFNKMLELGGKMLDEVFLNNMELDPRDLDALKTHNLSKVGVPEISKYSNQISRYGGVVTTQEDIILVEISQVIDKWIDEIENVLKYFVTGEQEQIDKIYLYGGCSKIKELADYFTSRLNIETISVDKLDCVKLNKRVDPGSIAIYLNAISALVRF